MDLTQLRRALHDFCTEAGEQLAGEAQAGEEIPFEVVEAGRRGAPLYCYRPLTTQFIRERGSVLGRLATYLPAAHALVAAGAAGSGTPCGAPPRQVSRKHRSAKAPLKSAAL